MDSEIGVVYDDASTVVSQFMDRITVPLPSDDDGLLTEQNISVKIGKKFIIIFEFRHYYHQWIKSEMDLNLIC